MPLQCSSRPLQWLDNTISRPLRWLVSGRKEFPGSVIGLVGTTLGGLPRRPIRAYIRPMNLDLTNEQSEALIRQLSQIIDGDRYPLSPRIVALKEILGKLRPEPERQPLLPRRHYEPPSRGRYRRRG